MDFGMVHSEENSYAFPGPGCGYFLREKVVLVFPCLLVCFNEKTGFQRILSEKREADQSDNLLVAGRHR
jgi:hypothetical protein